jgi:peptidoglycan/xylan/chitin deacetylase (PgdA/CDA1 family)
LHVKLTILMYHKVDEVPPDARYPGNYVSPAAFTEQLDALLEWGYRTIDFDDWLRYRTDSAWRFRARPLIITFDDGYTCFDRNAWPALKERGMSATVFLVAGQIGGTNAWDPDERQEQLLGADRIRRLQSEGVRFGSHGLTHLPLAKVPAETALHELAESRSVLTGLLGEPPTAFAYPFSNQNADVRRLAHEAGYLAAVRGGGRMNTRRTDPYGLRRIKPEPGMSIAQLRRILFFQRYLSIS